MFDIGFSELMVVLVVALVVIGPERLPKVARTMGQWWGRGQRYVNKMKSDISRDMELEELRQIKKKMEAEAGELEHSMRKTSLNINNELADFSRDMEKSADMAREPKKSGTEAE